MPKKNSQRERLATKADVAAVRLDFKLLREDLDDLAILTEKNFRRVDARIDKLQETLDMVVSTLNDLVATVKEIARDVKDLKEQNLGERMSKVENDVLELKTRVH